MYSYVDEQQMQRAIIARSQPFDKIEMTFDLENLSDFIGMGIVDTVSNEPFILLRFVKHWLMDGWCIVARLHRLGKKKHSPVNIIWENISSSAITKNDEMRENFSFSDS